MTFLILWPFKKTGFALTSLIPVTEILPSFMEDEKFEKSFSKWSQKNVAKKIREALDHERNSWDEKHLEVLLNSDDWLPSNVSKKKLSNICDKKMILDVLDGFDNDSAIN